MVSKTPKIKKVTNNISKIQEKKQAKQVTF
jgi:hypothetical protein